MTAFAAPTSVSDLPATLADLLPLLETFPGAPAFRLELATAGERPHFTYAHGPSPETPGYLFPMRDYRVTGDPRDPRNWHSGTLHLPASRDGRP